MNWLDKLGAHHKEWLKYVHSFGQCSCPEDIVQEMYLRLEHYSSPDKVLKPDGSVNKTYVWYTLNNLWKSYHTQNAKIHKEPIDNLHIYNEIQESGFEEAYDELIYRVNREIKTWSRYDQKLFKTYLDTGLSYRDLARPLNEGGTGIGFSSIANTISNCKDRLREAVGEDWQDIINGDYDKV